MGWGFFLCHQAFGDEKAVSGYAQCRVMMKAAPTASLEVPQAEFLLELLVIAFNAPAQFCKSHEFLDRRVSGQRAEEVSGRLELFAGPLDEQPLFFGTTGWLGPRGRRSAPVLLQSATTRQR